MFGPFWTPWLLASIAIAGMIAAAAKRFRLRDRATGGVLFALMGIEAGTLLVLVGLLAVGQGALIAGFISLAWIPTTLIAHRKLLGSSSLSAPVVFPGVLGAFLVAGVATWILLGHR